MRRHFIPKVIGAVVLLSALGGGVASAFTASNVVNTSYAGEGVGAVSGYVAYNIHYTLAQSGGTGPTYDNNANISGVAFNLNHPATSVGYVLYDSSNTAIGGGTCAAGSNGYGDSWICTETGSSAGYAPVQQVTQLDVIAAN